MTETSKPASIAEIHARYLEIAPGARAGTPNPALSLARWLTFAVQRGFTRMLSPHLPMDHGEMLVMMARFEALHLLTAALGEGRGEADRLAMEVLDAEEDGGGIGEWLYEHGQALGLDTGEVDRLADREAELEAAAAPAADVNALQAELAKVQRGAETLGTVVTHQARDLYAMWIDVARGDMPAVRERILNSIPDVDDNPADEQWNGTETGDAWFWRTRDVQVQPLLGGSWTKAGGDSIADHPDDCRGTCCKDAIEGAAAQDDEDDFVQDRHADYDAGEGGGAMTDADFYDRIAAGVAADQEREAEQHARDMAAEDGDLDDCEPTL